MRAAEQAVRPHDQHHRHHQEFGDQRQLGEVDGDKPEIDHADADADCFNLGDDHGGEIGAGDRAHATDDDDHEGVADRDQIGGKVCRLARNLQRAAKAGERRADREHRSEQKRLIDAERAHHFAILRSGAHKSAETRAGKREMQRQQHQWAHHDQEHIVCRQSPAQHLDRAAQARRARAEQIFGTPQPKCRVTDDQHQREGREQLEQFGCAIDPPQQHDLDQHADGGDDKSRRDYASPKPERPTDVGSERIRSVGPQHVQGPMRDVDDARNTENQ